MARKSKSKSKKSSESKIEIQIARELHSEVGEGGCCHPLVSSSLGKIQTSSAAPVSELTSSHLDEREPTVPRGRLEKSCRGVSQHRLTHTHTPAKVLKSVPQKNSASPTDMTARIRIRPPLAASLT